jgi:hypothetical protein
MKERADRVLEETVETFQSAGRPEGRAHVIVQGVFAKAPGDLRQQIGGLMHTLAAMCEAAGFDLLELAEAEFARVDTPETIKRCRQKQAAKAALVLANSMRPGETPPLAWPSLYWGEAP